MAIFRFLARSETVLADFTIAVTFFIILDPTQYKLFCVVYKKLKRIKRSQQLKRETKNKKNIVLASITLFYILTPVSLCSPPPLYFIKWGACRNLLSLLISIYHILAQKLCFGKQTKRQTKTNKTDGVSK